MFTQCPHYSVLLREQSSWTKLSTRATALFFLTYLVTRYIYYTRYLGNSTTIIYLSIKNIYILKIYLAALNRGNKRESGISKRKI